ncbi:MAG: hypothetical protein QOC89_1963 [Paraburkholderia sp.]|jgi:hypothetical protein|nr:hypothetical protein [Paraburkholderia sp.]
MIKRGERPVAKYGSDAAIRRVRRRNPHLLHPNLFAHSRSDLEVPSSKVMQGSHGDNEGDATC